MQPYSGTLNSIVDRAISRPSYRDKHHDCGEHMGIRQDRAETSDPCDAGFVESIHKCKRATGVAIMDREHSMIFTVG